LKNILPTAKIIWTTALGLSYPFSVLNSEFDNFQTKTANQWTNTQIPKNAPFSHFASLPGFLKRCSSVGASEVQRFFVIQKRQKGGSIEIMSMMSLFSPLLFSFPFPFLWFLLKTLVGVRKP